MSKKLDIAMQNPHILLFERPSARSERMLETLASAGYRISRVEEESPGEPLLDTGEVQLILGEAGPSLSAALALAEGPELILFEDFAGIGADFAHLKQAAFDTLPRPVSDEEVLRVVRRALEHRELLSENRRLRSTVAERFELGLLVSRDKRIGRIFETVEAVADSKASILIGGESGTGKTMLARAIHERSSRAQSPFIAVNCGAIPESLLESELFGHARGSFTGAVKDRIGKFEAAEGGTIFLDEIGTASPELQIKLLRVLEEGCFERVGENVTRHVNARLISATNADLPQEVEAGNFRADLYYRINVVGIHVPPLRERVSDVPLLAARFLERYNEAHGRQVVAIDKDCMTRLCSHHWPGNIRELENSLERAVLMAKGPSLGIHDIWPASEPAGEQPGSQGTPGEAGVPRLEDQPVGPLRHGMQVVERWLIARALEQNAGSRNASARVLGINRTTLFNKMRKYELLSVSPPVVQCDDDPEAGASAQG